MSVDNVSVSLSRLALAKAIKTADSDEPGAEPWNKSVIFHQSHISQAMLESVQYPQRHPRQRQNRIQPMTRRRPDQRKSAPITQYRPQPPVKKKQPITTASVSSHSSADDDDDDNTSEDIDLAKELAAISIQRPPSAPLLRDNNRKFHKTPQPSDDDEDDTSEADDNNKQSPRPSLVVSEEHNTYARRASTLRQLEQGITIHHRSRSLGDIDEMLHELPSESEVNGPLTPATPVSSSNSSTSASGGKRCPESDTVVNNDQYSDRAIRNTPMPEGANNDHSRRSTMSEMDMLYRWQIHQQQQLQAQQQQMAQQYQRYHQNLQAMMMQQSMMCPSTPTRHQKSSSSNNINRLSMSGIDLLIQREQEQYKFKKQPPKKFDSAHAQIDGLLARLPERGIHNISFQAETMKARQQQQRKSEFLDRRPHSSNAGYFYDQSSTDARRRAEIRRSSHHITPTQSMSTPSMPAPSQSSYSLGHHSMVMQQQQQPYMQPHANLSMMSLPVLPMMPAQPMMVTPLLGFVPQQQPYPWVPK